MEKINRAKAVGSIFVLVILISSSIAVFFIIPATKARAILISPRLGVPMRGPSVEGYRNSSGIAGQVEIQISIEPIDVPIPSRWLNKENWKVYLVPSVLRSGISYLLSVETVKRIDNPSVFISEGLDTSNLYETAISLVCNIPNSLHPVLYDIIVAFSTTESQINEYLSLYEPKPGSWKSMDGSYSKTFIVSEPSCLYLPWQFDAESFDGIKTVGDKFLVNPFSILHVTDSHYSPNRTEIMGNNSGWERDSHILAPELIILSGDLMENPAETISEYDTAYQRLINLGSPVLITSGNHDQKNLGPWYHYFGSSFGAVVCSDVKIGYMTNVLPVGTPVFEYMSRRFVENRKSVNIMIYHYPPEPSYAGASWISLLEMAITNNIDALLVGHNHIDAVVPIEVIFDYSTLSGGRTQLIQLLAQLSEEQEYLGPITRPHLILTRSAGKPSRSASDYLSPSTNETINQYSGYRRLVIQNNKILNYTYDYNNSGVRDAHNCIPVGRFNWAVTKDANFGTDPAAKAYITLINNLNEFIPAARIPLLLENAPTGKAWAPTSSNASAGVYIRTQFSNTAQTWLDIRAPLSPFQNITIVIEMTNGG